MEIRENVIATAKGYYNGRVWQRGERFVYVATEENHLIRRPTAVKDKDGVPVKDEDGFDVREGEPKKGGLPSWLVKDTPEARDNIAKGIRGERKESEAAARAAAGPKRAKRGFVSAEEHSAEDLV